jgi:hypothetical protein
MKITTRGPRARHARLRALSRIRRPASRNRAARNVRIDGRYVSAFPTVRVSRHSGAAPYAIATPYIDPAVLAEPPSPPMPPDNLLLASVRNQPINVLWGGFDDAYAGDIITFFYSGIEFARIDVDGTETPPFVGMLPAAARLREGTDLISIFYEGATGGERSANIPLTVDYTPPGDPAPLSPLLFADDILKGGITAGHLIDDGSGAFYVPAEIASYNGMADGDRAHLYCNGMEAPDAGRVEVVNDHIQVRLYESFLEAVGDTPEGVFTYRLEDRAGNISQASLPVTVKLQISEIPGLEEPAVPAYDDDPDDPLINEADARGANGGGFVIVVPWNDAFLPTDQLLVALDAVEAGPVGVGAEGDDTEVLYPYAASQQVWLAGSPGEDQRVTAQATYTVLRNGARAGTSPQHEVELNLYQKVVDPDPEDPVNQALTAPTVVSSSGQSNRIPVDDFGKDATIKVKKLSDPTYPPQTDAFEAGDILRIHYGSQPTFDVTVPALGDRGEPLDIPLAGAVIEAEGSGEAIPVWYEVLHALTDGGENSNLSPTTEVLVQGTDTMPGKGHLDPGMFPDADERGFLPQVFHYTSTRFHIPDYANRDPDDVVDVHFQLFQGPNHLPGETPYPPKYDFRASVKAGLQTPIEVTVPSESYNLKGNEDGLSANVHIHAFYTITKLRGDTTPVTSDQADLKVDARFSSTGSGTAGAERRRRRLQGRRGVTKGGRLYPPQGPTAGIPAPVVHGTLNGGLRRDQLLGDFAIVNISVGPWDFPSPDDTVELHWGTLWTLGFPGSTSGALLLAIPGAQIAGAELPDHDHYMGEGVHEVWYEVRTAGGGVGVSAKTTVLVKTARPGGEDPLPDTSVNEGLMPCTATPDPVEQDSKEVVFSVVPWKSIEVGDVLALYLGGYRFDFPPVTEPTETQQVTLTAEQIATIGGGPQTPVTYEVIDKVGNRSKYAPYLLLDIWVEPRDRLETIELFDGASNVIGGNIDPNMEDGFARVPRYAGWKAGEVVTVVLEGTDRDGVEHPTTLPPKTWTAADYYLDFPVPMEALLPLQGGVVRVHYETDAGARSFRRLYIIDALPEERLPQVTLVGERDGALALDDIPESYASIVIPDSEALVDFARITLTMRGSGETGPVLEEEVHNVPGGQGHVPYTFTWDKARILPLLDHTATFSYSIRTIDGQRLPNGRVLARPMGIRESEPHDVTVVRVGQPGQLASPVVHDLVDGMLDPTLPRLRLTVPSGEYSIPGARVTATVEGLVRESETQPIFDAGESLDFDFTGWPRQNDGSPAKAWYDIVVNGTSHASAEARFFVGEAGALPAPAIDQDVGGQALAISLKDGMTVRIPETAGIDPAASVVVEMAGRGIEGSYASPRLPGTTRMHTIPPTRFGRNFGRTVAITYTVEYGPAKRTSDSTSLLIVAFADGTAQLPQPVILETVGGTLDLETFTGDAHAEVPAWPLMAAGQHLWLELAWEGGRIELANGREIGSAEVGNAIGINVPRTRLEDIANGTSLTLRAAVDFLATAREEDSIAFPLARMALRSTPRFREDFESSNPGDRETQTMTIRLGEIAAQGKDDPPYITGRHIRGKESEDGRLYVFLDLKLVARSCTFGVDQDVLVEWGTGYRREVTRGWVTIESPTPFEGMIIHAALPFRADNFTFEPW